MLRTGGRMTLMSLPFQLFDKTDLNLRCQPSMGCWTLILVARGVNIVPIITHLQPAFMFHHHLMLPSQLHALIRKESITLGGNKRLKIYGRLHCNSGMRMKNKNRVFFANKEEATGEGYRPCGHCMKVKYLEWKTIQPV